MVTEENPSLVRLVDKGKEAVEQYQIKIRPLSKADFDVAFDSIVPETRSADLTRFGEWQDAHST